MALMGLSVVKAKELQSLCAIVEAACHVRQEEVGYRRNTPCPHLRKTFRTRLNALLDEHMRDMVVPS